MTDQKVRMTQEKEKYRVQLDFSGAALKELDELKLLFNASARAEVMRNALRWLYWCTHEVAQGATILVERDGKQREIVFPFSMQTEQTRASLKAGD